MDILVINGSPRRKGNTSLLLREIAKGEEEKGAKVDFVDLVDQDINGCLACMHCKREASCAQQDDMQQLYERIKRADALLLGSPIYMGAETGQTKCFVDRLYALLGPRVQGAYTTRLEGDKKAVVLFTCGAKEGDKVYDNLKSRYTSTMGRLLGYRGTRTFIVGGMDPTSDCRELPQSREAIAEGRRFLGE